MRPLLGATALACALLLVVPSPASPAWLLAIVLEGYGFVLAIAALFLFWPGWRGTWHGRLGAGLGLMAAVFAISPLLRVHGPAARLPARLQAAFGPAPPVPHGRSRPFSLDDVLLGIDAEPVDTETLVYRRPHDRALRMDLYRPPEAETPPPVIVMIHGGAWHRGDRTQLALYNHYLARRGFAVAAIDYRLAPKWQFPTQLQDIRHAVQYLLHHGAGLGLDSERIVLAGRSAGAHLALLAAYRLDVSQVRGVMALYGPVDLLWGYENPSSPLVLDSCAVLEGFLGGSPTEKPEQYRAASSHHFVTGDAPPALLLHGDLDEFVSPYHSTLLVQALREHDVRHLLVRIPWGHHAFDLVPGSPGAQLSLFAMEHFLAAVTAE